MDDVNQGATPIFPDDSLLEAALQALLQAKPEATNQPAPALEPLLEPHRNRNREIQGDFHILVSILEIDPEWAGRFRFNLFSSTAEWQDELGNWCGVSDSRLRHIRLTLYTRYRVVVGPNVLPDALMTVAEKAPVDPLREYIVSLHNRWDGVERLSGLFSRYFPVRDAHPIYEVYAKKWALMCIHRALHPGTPAHVMLVFQGEQGRGKSRGSKALLPDASWYAQAHLDPNEKDTVLVTQGKWLVEVAELVGMSKHDVEALKLFLSKDMDEIRPPYGRSVERYPRRCLFIGTTNSDSFLGDPTGSRRYWVVPIEWVDVDSIDRDRDQIWAEAYALYVELRRSGRFVYWLTEEEERQREELAHLWSAEEPWVPEVVGWLRKTGGAPFTMAQLMSEVMQAPSTDRSIIQLLGNVLRSYGFLKERKRTGGTVITLWKPSRACKIVFESCREPQGTLDEPSPASGG